MLLNRPSGDLFGWSQNAGMGWNPQALGGGDILILSTHGGIRADDGTPIALGYHTGHWEVGLLMQAAAKELSAQGAVPFGAYCTDPCDGRTQGTPGMFDSLAYRNDAATIFRRLIRSLPTRNGVIGVATCDKGLPAMMLALAGTRDLPSDPGPVGVTLLAGEGADAGRLPRDQRAGSTPGRCAAERAGCASYRAGVPGRRRSRSDAAPAPGGPAASGRADRQRRAARPDARLVGAIGAARRAAPKVAGTG